MEAASAALVGCVGVPRGSSSIACASCTRSSACAIAIEAARRPPALPLRWRRRFLRRLFHRRLLERLRRFDVVASGTVGGAGSGWHAPSQSGVMRRHLLARQRHLRFVHQRVGNELFLRRVPRQAVAGGDLVEAGIGRVPLDAQADPRRIVFGEVGDDADDDGVDAQNLRQPPGFVRRRSGRCGAR